jgi:uncharacterized delta-60 repeat protein
MSAAALSVLSLLAFGPAAIASSGGVHISKPLKGNAPRAAHLDPAFGEAGRTTLPPEFFEGSPIPVLMRDDSLVLGSGRSLTRLTPDGQLDASFGEAGTLTPPGRPDGDFEVDGLVVDSQDRLIVAGTSTLPAEDFLTSLQIGNGTPERPKAARIMRYLPSGSLDPSFGDRGVVETDFGLPPPVDETGQPLLSKPWVKSTGVAVDGEGRVVLTGGSSVGVRFGCFHDWFFNTLTYAAFVARFTERGVPDASFGGGDGIFGGRSTEENPLRAELSGAPTVHPDGSLTYAQHSGPCPRREGSVGLAKLAPNGESSPSFGAGGAVRRFIGEVAVEPGGSILALGWVFPWYNLKEPLRVRVTRFGTNGRPVRSYGRNGHAIVKSPGGAGSGLNTLALDARGRALLGGTMIRARTFRSPLGSTKKRHRRFFVLVRLRANGRLDRAFGPWGRLAVRFGPLAVSESSLLLDSEGRAVMVGTYGRWNHPGLAVARYVIDR